MPGKAQQVGPYSRPHRLRKIDGRTSLGIHVHQFERGLIADAGGAPDFATAALIDQAVGLEVQIKLLERDGIKSDHDRRCYSAWLNAKRLTLREIKKAAAKAAPKAPTLDEILAEDARRRHAESQEGAPAA